MKVYRNMITGNTIETDGVLSGKNWELVAAKKKKRKSSGKKKQLEKDEPVKEEVTETEGESK